MDASVSLSQDLSPLFSGHRVLVCVGAGGVGKTTVAAALALAAAQSGKRTLCLTIDPARRLASSLGLDSFPLEEMEVPDEFLRSHGVELQASLTVMMLDARATFDGLIRKFARSSDEADRILRHKVYHHLASNLAGTQAYMAMEKVLSVLDDERYDLVVLDTPPSARTLDFFDAPRKMSEILDSPATRALVQALGQGRRLRLGLLAAGVSRAIRALEGIAGTSMIIDVAQLLSEMNGLFGGFAARASEVDGRLHGREFGYVLVTAPDEATVTDARELRREMKARDLRLDALAINRVAPPGLSDAEDADCSLAGNLGLSQEGRATAVSLAREQAERRETQLARCVPLIEDLGPDVLRVLLPAFAEDVHQPEKLMQVARVIAPR